MTDSEKKVLLIEDDPIDAELIYRYLRSAPEFKVVHAPHLAAGLEHLRAAEFDLILLDLMLPDSRDNETFKRVHDVAGICPIVVLTGSGNENEGLLKVRQGAHDYLIKGEFSASLLIRIIRYAVERSALLHEIEQLREHERHDQEIQALRAHDADKTSSGVSLKEHAPDLYVSMIGKFQSYLDLAVERRFYKSDGNVLRKGINEFASDLSRIGAGPKELVDIYSVALEGKMADSREIKEMAYLEEGRFVLLETMGALVKKYRDLSRPLEN